jgi:LysR family hydrogen peroxide-inducible transcriptional activator
VQQFQATSLETLRHLVSSGFGYTVVPQLAVREDPRLKRWIGYRPLDGPAVGRDIVLACRKRFSRMEQIEMLANFVREHLPKGLRLLGSDTKY